METPSVRRPSCRLLSNALRTLAAITLVFSDQAVLYVVRERIWSSRPSSWLMASSVADVLIISTLAITGTIMTALPVGIIASVFTAAVVFAFVLDQIKVAIFARLKMVEYPFLHDTLYRPQYARTTTPSALQSAPA